MKTCRTCNQTKPAAYHWVLTHEQALDTKSVAGILLREFDNVEQAIRYAERMAQRYADSRSLMAIEYQDAAEELKTWKNKSKHP